MCSVYCVVLVELVQLIYVLVDRRSINVRVRSVINKINCVDYLLKQLIIKHRGIEKQGRSDMDPSGS